MVMLDFISIVSQTAELLGTERERTIQNENIILQRDLNPRPALHNTSIKRSRPLGHGGLTMNNVLMSYRIMWYKLIKLLRGNTCQMDYGYMCIGTDYETKSTFLIPAKVLASIITVSRTLHWLSNHNRFHICIVACPFVFIKIRIL